MGTLPFSNFVHVFADSDEQMYLYLAYTNQAHSSISKFGGLRNSPLSAIISSGQLHGLFETIQS